MMKQYIVDFTKVKTFWGFYEAIKKGLELPDWCGENSDAIWDMLTGYMEYPAEIYLLGIHKLPKDLERQKNLILQVFQDASNYYGEQEYTIKIMD